MYLTSNHILAMMAKSQDLQSQGPFPTNVMGRQFDFRPQLGLVDCQTSLSTADNPLKYARTMAGYRRHPTSCTAVLPTANW
ncbi:hypothetical protein EAE99_002562 [Botrytis elliptica]|nr:hypothetical protein EAE99_002562 [Botrytis elliptica]